ncbi:DUF4198 domain-containing protein [Zobellella sp. DQSA1]|uniref:DUF4198 domain-containing protein n=1 Tax=Zobellella sp. DQSA1 TaxID=3342386 RepID=UPI0035C0F8AB
MKAWTSSLAALALVAGGASAHPIWMLPSEFSLSTEEAHWITVDATASHGVFSFDKPIGLDNVTLYGPANEPRRIGPYFKGQRRSVFDMELADSGTYKVELRSPERYFTSYVVGGRDTQRRIFGNKVEIQSELPKAAREVTTFAAQTISAFYVTKQAPSQAVLAVTGKGFELDALTHPSDVVVGEEARFRFTFDGEPVAELKVEVVPHGTAFRDSRMQTELVTDQDGVVRFTPELAGPHLLSTNLRRTIDSPLADQAGVNYLLSFEALPE